MVHASLCSKLLHQRKQARLQWLQNPSQMNRDNLKDKMMSYNQIVRTNMLEASTEQ
jgi:hypothetical protein